MGRHIVPELPLKHLNRISPSRFFSLQSCILREVWSADTEIKDLLPQAPIIKIGTVIHKILELVVKGIVKNEEDAIKQWNREISVTESLMCTNWIEEHLLPLSRKAKYYEVKRQQCLNMVRNMIEGRGGGLTRSTSMEAEVWVELKNGKVAGKIDIVRQTSDGIQIVDYKTGAVLDVDTGIVKYEYQQQLKIYAALYYAKYDIWPERLVILTLDHKEYDVPFIRSECMDLVEKASAKLDEVNDMITATKRPVEIANPTPDNCRYCSFRPACEAYWKTRDMSGLWPMDCNGKIISLKVLGNGSLMVTLNNGLNNMIIRGLDPKRHRICQFDDIEMYFYNLNQDAVPGHYTENLLTTYYYKNK